MNEVNYVAWPYEPFVAVCLTCGAVVPEVITVQSAESGLTHLDGKKRHTDWHEDAEQGWSSL